MRSGFPSWESATTGAAPTPPTDYERAGNVQEFRIIIEPDEDDTTRFRWTLQWSGPPLGFGVRESRISFATKAGAVLAARLAARRMLKARFFTNTTEASIYVPTQEEVEATN